MYVEFAFACVEISFIIKMEKESFFLTIIFIFQMEGQEIELDNDQRFLSYYSIEPGDTIQVKI